MIISNFKVIKQSSSPKSSVSVSKKKCVKIGKKKSVTCITAQKVRIVR